MAYSNLQIFTVELIGTFILVVFATGSIVYDAEVFDGSLGIPFAAVAPFIALLIGVYSFGKISLAHFNPAVTIGYYITGHISKIQVVYYFVAEIIGAILGSLFVLTFIGDAANLGANAPNYDFSIFLINILPGFLSEKWMMLFFLNSPNTLATVCLEVSVM